MKKLVVAFVLLFMASQTYAQKFRYGLTVTPLMFNWLKSNSDSIESDGIKLGFTYGATFEIKLYENLALSSGIHVMYRGGKLTYLDTLRKNINGIDSMTSTNYNWNITSQYIELPVCLKMSTKEINHFKYFGLFGIGLGYNIKGNSKLEYDGKTIENKKFNENLVGFHTALHIGGGAEYNISGSTWLVGSIYWNNGFTDILDAKSKPANRLETKDAKANTNNIGVSIGVLF